MSLSPPREPGISPDDEARLRSCLIAALKQEDARWPLGDTGDATMDWALERIRFHGLCLALVECGGNLLDWPEALRLQIFEEARLQGLWEATHVHVLTGLLAALSEAGIDVLVNKGTAVAYSVPGNPAWRRRGDTDLLARPEQQDALRDLLATRGFQRVQASPRQEDWAYDTGAGFVHSFDIHWDASASAALSQFYTFDEAFARARDLPRIGPAARGVDPVLLFLSDALNQALHHANGYLVADKWIRDDHRLIWTLGTDGQARAFSDEDWQDLAKQAAARGMSGLCLRALVRAQEALTTPVPADVLRKLGAGGDWGRVDRFLYHDNAWQRFRRGWREEPAWRGRRRILLANLFPPGHFMRHRFPQMERFPLPILYLRRLSEGALKLARQVLGKS